MPLGLAALATFQRKVAGRSSSLQAAAAAGGTTPLQLYVPLAAAAPLTCCRHWFGGKLQKLHGLFVRLTAIVFFTYYVLLRDLNYVQNLSYVINIFES